MYVKERNAVDRTGDRGTRPERGRALSAKTHETSIGNKETPRYMGYGFEVMCGWVGAFDVNAHAACRCHCWQIAVQRKVKLEPNTLSFKNVMTHEPVLLNSIIGTPAPRGS